MPVKQDFTVVSGQPFEHEFDIDYDIFDEDKIDSTIPFIIKNSDTGFELRLEFNYGLTTIKFDNAEKSKLIVSIYETDMIPEGTYAYEYHGKTFSGREIGSFSGTISILDGIGHALPSQKRDVRPWDLLRSKSPGEAGERAPDEVREKRLSICKECPRFVKLTSQCLECGCIMNLKTKLLHASCPIGKW